MTEKNFSQYERERNNNIFYTFALTRWLGMWTLSTQYFGGRGREMISGQSTDETAKSNEHRV